MGRATKSQPPMRVVRMVVGEEVAGVVLAPVSRWKTWALWTALVVVVALSCWREYRATQRAERMEDVILVLTRNLEER